MRINVFKYDMRASDGIRLAGSDRPSDCLPIHEGPVVGPNGCIGGLDGGDARVACRGPLHALLCSSAGDAHLEDASISVEEARGAGARDDGSLEVRAEATLYRAMVQYQVERPDLCELLAHSGWILSIKGIDLSIPVPGELKWNISDATTLVANDGRDVDLLLHRCVSRAEILVKGRRLHQWIFNAKHRGAPVHRGWQFECSSTETLRIEFDFVYLVPDAAWNARLSINSPPDGAPYGAGHVRLRDRDWGITPARLLVSASDLLSLVPGDRWDGDTASHGLLPLVRYVESLPITHGFAGDMAVSSDCSTAKLMKAGTTWFGDLGQCPSDTAHYFRKPWNLSCIQRIFSVQHIKAVAASVHVVDRVVPPKLGPGRRRRRSSQARKHK